MSRWESPTFNSSLVGDSLKVGTFAFGQCAAPLGGTQHFSHHAFATTGAEVPAWSREHAWRFSYFYDHGGATTSNRKLTDKPTTEQDRLKQQEAAEQAWKTFVEKEAPKRLASRKPLPNDPSAYHEVKQGKSLTDEKFEEWKKQKEKALLKTKQAEEGEMAKIRAEVQQMLEHRAKAAKVPTSNPSSDKNKKKVPSTKQKAVQDQLLMLKKQNNPLAQKVRLRLPKVSPHTSKDSHKKSLSKQNGETLKAVSQKAENENSDNTYSDDEFHQQITSSSSSSNNNNLKASSSLPSSPTSQILSRSGASIVSSSSSSSSSTRYSFPPNLSNMASLTQVTRDPVRTPTATAAKALILEEALDSYLVEKSSPIQKTNHNTNNEMKKNKKSKPQWDGRFSAKDPVEDKGKKTHQKRSDNVRENQKIPIFNQTCPPPSKLITSQKQSSHSHRSTEGKDIRRNSSGDPSSNNSNVTSKIESRESASPPWSGFAGDGDGGDGSGDGCVDGEPWNYQNHFAAE